MRSTEVTLSQFPVPAARKLRHKDILLPLLKGQTNADIALACPWVADRVLLIEPTVKKISLV
jgi:hypothetical protein